MITQNSKKCGEFCKKIHKNSRQSPKNTHFAEKIHQKPRAVRKFTHLRRQIREFSKEFTPKTPKNSQKHDILLKKLYNNADI